MSVFNFDFNYIRNGAPLVTLSATGLAFNYICVSMLKSPEHVIIGYDSVAHVIGVKATSADDPNGYMFASRMKNNWVRIGCRDFIKSISLQTGINCVNKARQFYSEYDAENSILIVHIDDKHIKHIENKKNTLQTHE